jgi:hypothetical protein
MNDISHDDRARAISRHTLAYMLCSISELFRTYDFDPIDLLIIHAILNANVLEIMKDPELDMRFASLFAVEPDSAKRGVSRGGLSRFLNLPPETVRRRVDQLKKRDILLERDDGLIISEENRFRFGNNHHLQQENLVFLRKLLKDLARTGVHSADDL